LACIGVGGCNGVNDGLGFFVANFCFARELLSYVLDGVGRRHTLVVVYYISKVISAAIMGFPHAHRVVGEVDIAVVALKGLLDGGYAEAFERS
jgi:hypothetical protein